MHPYLNSQLSTNILQEMRNLNWDNYRSPIN